MGPRFQTARFNSARLSLPTLVATPKLRVPHLALNERSLCSSKTSNLTRFHEFFNHFITGDSTMSFPLKAAFFSAALFAATTTHAQAPANYTAKCQMCHGATGLADSPAGKAMGAKSFKLPEVLKESDADLTGIIKSGKGKMPAFTGKLKDPEIAALVVYIRTLQK